MNWFRKHVKAGARLAMLALAIQFVLSFAHFHPIAAQAAPAIQNNWTQADLDHADVAAVPSAIAQSAQQQQPADSDHDQKPDDRCAICAVIALAGKLLVATPPVLLPPQAIELLGVTTDVELAQPRSARHAFQSRAPPLS